MASWMIQQREQGPHSLGAILLEYQNICINLELEILNKLLGHIGRKTRLF